MKITYEFDLSDKSIELLKRLKKEVQFEFRDREDSLEEFKKSDDYLSGRRTEHHFLQRNACDFKDLEELLIHDLIDQNDMSWHTTYILSPLGLKIMEQNNL